MYIGTHPPSRGSYPSYPNFPHPRHLPIYTYTLPSPKLLPKDPPSKPLLAATQMALNNGQGSFFFAEFAYYILRLFMPHRNTMSGGSLHQFCHSLIRSCCPTVSSLLPALAYLERVRAKNPKWISHQPQDQLFTVSMILASKYIDDMPLPNSHWAAISNSNPRQINSLEIELFDVSSYTINFDTNLYNAWCLRLDQFIVFKSNQQPLYYFPPSPTLVVSPENIHQAQCCCTACCSSVHQFSAPAPYYTAPAYPTGSIAYPMNAPSYPGLNPTRLVTPFGSAVA
ncbi:hypothetical protein DSO57_1005357 [Entomophthora muscae]|uniref:Uncharacterized protein n=1 Tax=Entomophthora muscae TaxID=34485 RepID=A0ACC2RMP1_9FUNG|nr:hypothetical protein DSO57_1005357 [Entomophthora muscae]